MVLRRRRGRGARLKVRAARSSRPGESSRRCRPRTAGYDPRPDSPEPGGAARRRAYGACARRRMPGPRPGGVHRRTSGRVRMGRALEAQCAMRDTGFSSRPISGALAAGGRCAWGVRSAPVPGARCGRQCSRGRPRGVAGCAWGVRSGRTPVTRQRIPESTDHECVGWSTAGCGWARSLRGGRPLRGGCPAPRPERRVPVVERAGAHGACAQGQMPVVWQWILRSTKARRRCQAARCAWGVRSAPVPGAGGSAHEAVHEGLPGAHGACAQAGCPLRGNEFPGRPINARCRGAAGCACGVRSEASVRCVAAVPGLDRRGVCRWRSAQVIMGRALRPDTRYAATDPPIYRGPSVRRRAAR